jgi:hypothetical protein
MTCHVQGNLPKCNFVGYLINLKMKLDNRSLQKNHNSSGLAVRAEDSRLRGHGFKSHRILDGCKQC